MIPKKYQKKMRRTNYQILSLLFLASLVLWVQIALAAEVEVDMGDLSQSRVNVRQNATSSVEDDAIGYCSLPYIDCDVETQVRAIAAETGFKWPSYLIKLARCESSLNPKATHVNRNGTTDRGLFQWNTIHKDVTDACAFDVDCATRKTIDTINAGHQSWWVCDGKI